MHFKSHSGNTEVFKHGFVPRRFQNNLKLVKSAGDSKTNNHSDEIYRAVLSCDVVDYVGWIVD